MTFGPQVCGSLHEGALREWLLTDGLGGYAMGTVGGLRTRRYHGLLIAATQPPIGRMLGLVSYDPVLNTGTGTGAGTGSGATTTRLATHEWHDGTIAPQGYRHLVAFEQSRGVARWEWRVNDIVLERVVAMMHGRNAIAIVHRILASPAPVRVEFEALCTWRDVHGERRANGTPQLAVNPEGFTFEGAFSMRAEGFESTGAWFNGVHHRVEAERGLTADEDLWFAGRFVATIEPGEAHESVAWSGHGAEPPRAGEIITTAHTRADNVIRASVGALVGTADDRAGGRLALAADQFVVSGRGGPTVVAGYPWFGDWSRDTMTSYEGLFLLTGRYREGESLLRAAAASLSEGMLANTADAGGLQYNTVDAALWFVHAIDRHVLYTGEPALLIDLLDALLHVITHYRSGTRFGIRVDESDGLVTQGQDGMALTWMDARLPEGAVTPRIGKPVEINALWINALAVVAAAVRVHRTDPALSTDLGQLHTLALTSFRRFVRADGLGLLDVLDGPGGHDPSIRPNQLLAGSLPHGPLHDAASARMLVRACTPLLTPLGLRSLHPDDPRYRPRHVGDVRARDTAYHQGTVWPWMIGPFVDACLLAGDPASRTLAELAIEPLMRHLDDWGFGSVSETANGEAPHEATGCPFQAWSVAELLRARHSLRAVTPRR